MTFLRILRLRRMHILTLTNPRLLHHRLFSTSNSGGDGLDSNQPSPSKPGSQTFMKKYLSEQLQLPKQLKQITLMRNHRGVQLHKKWKQFEANSESLKDSGADHRRLSSEFNESRKAYLDQIIKMMSKFRRLMVDMDRQTFREVLTQEMVKDKAGEIFSSTSDLGFITNKGVELLGVLSNSRASLCDEMIKNLSEIRKEWTFLKDLSEDLRKVKWNNNEEEELLNQEEELNEELWNGLNEELGNVRWNELHQALIGCRGGGLV